MSFRNRLFRRFSVMGLPIVLLAALMTAQAPAHGYSPGGARAISLQYNAYSGKWEYGCYFEGWRDGAKVVYHCELVSYTNQRGYWVMDDTTGSWTPGANNVARYGASVVPVGSGNICVRARAYSVDGGANGGYQMCRWGW